MVFNTVLADAALSQTARTLTGCVYSEGLVNRPSEPALPPPRTYVQPLRRLVFRLGGVAVFLLASLALAAGELVGGGFVLAFAIVLFAIARSSVTTSLAGIAVQNPFRRRFVPWADVIDFEYARLPQLRLGSGKTIGLEGVEPFPAAWPTKQSIALLEAFDTDLRSHL